MAFVGLPVYTIILLFITGMTNALPQQQYSSQPQQYMGNQPGQYHQQPPPQGQPQEQPQGPPPGSNEAQLISFD